VTEYRIAAADINPYIALAAAIGSGLWGIDHRIEPDAPIVGNAYAQTIRRRAGCCARCGTRRRGSSNRNRPEICSATPSSSITRRRANGRSASSAKPSPIGSSPGISRSFDRYLKMRRASRTRLPPRLRGRGLTNSPRFRGAVGSTKRSSPHARASTAAVIDPPDILRCCGATLAPSPP
jgi:hypothetical protein